MKQVIFSLLLATLLLSIVSCKKKEPECHYAIYIKNDSDAEVNVAVRIENENGNCRLDGLPLASGATHEYRPYNYCIEEALKVNPAIEIYIADPANFNDTAQYYACDSILYKNTILKHFELTLDDLKSANFNVVYP